MINEKIDYLLSMTDEEWGRYAFELDPLNKKIDNDLKEEMILKANKCGQDAAKKIRESYGNISIKDIAKKLSLNVTYKDAKGMDNYIVFACYNSPNKITVFRENIKMAMHFIKEEKLENKLNNVNLEDILIAHEMFHYLEENNKEMYSNQEKIVLWKLGKFNYKSKLIALGEIAAMAFAKELLKLTYNPYLFDVLMLYPHDATKTDNLLEEITNLKERIV